MYYFWKRKSLDNSGYGCSMSNVIPDFKKVGVELGICKYPDKKGKKKKETSYKKIYPDKKGWLIYDVTSMDECNIKDDVHDAKI